MSDAVWCALNDRLTASEARISEMVQQIIELKRDGFDRPRIAVTPDPIPDTDDRITKAIRARAPEGSSLERELMTYANAMLLAENEIEDVADAILSGAHTGGDDD